MCFARKLAQADESSHLKTSSPIKTKHVMTPIKHDYKIISPQMFKSYCYIQAITVIFFVFSLHKISTISLKLSCPFHLRSLGTAVEK